MTPSARAARSASGRFAIGVARAVGGALIFSLPVLMTMEMWSLGLHMERERLALLLLLNVPLLVGLSHFSGFEETFDAVSDVLDAFVAYAVAFVTAAAVLALLGVLGGSTSLGEIAGQLAIQAVPGSMGALLAQSMLGPASEGEEEDQPAKRPSSYWSQLFLMGVGALFLAFNVAPTEEMVLLAYMMSPWHVAALAVVSLGAMHAFVYAVEFSGQEEFPEGTPWWSVFLRFTVVGYAIALAISAYVLWTFGRLDGSGMHESAATVLVLGFPAAIGAAAARLLL